MLAEQKASLMEKCEVFREKLEGFARKHKVRFRTKREHLARFGRDSRGEKISPRGTDPASYITEYTFIRRLPECHGQNLAFNVLFVPHSLDSNSA